MKKLRFYLLLSVGVVTLVVVCPAACSDTESVELSPANAGQAGTSPDASVAGVAGGGTTGGAKGGGGGKAGSGGAGLAGVAGTVSDGGTAGTSPCQEGQPAWTCDPALWLETGIENDPCQLKTINMAKTTFAAFEWKSCGLGCDFMELKMPPFEKAFHSSGAFFSKDDVYIKVDTSWKEPQRRRASMLIKNKEGTVTAAVLATQVVKPSGYHYCGNLQYGRDAPSYFTYTASVSEEDSGYISGKPSPATQLVDWNKFRLPWIGVPLGAFDFDEGWGILAGGIGLVTSKDQKAFKMIGSSSGFAVDGQKDVIVWPGPPAKGFANTLQRYSAKDGQSTLLDQAVAPTINRVALSDEHLAWISTEGVDGTYEKAFLSWALFPATSNTIPAEQISTISLPAKNGLSHIKTFGNYAATSLHFSSDPGTARIAVVQLSSKKVWYIPYRPGNWLGPVMAISPDELFVREISEFGDTTSVERVVRLQIKHLDDIVAAWTPK